MTEAYALKGGQIVMVDIQKESLSSEPRRSPGEHA